MKTLRCTVALLAGALGMLSAPLQPAMAKPPLAAFSDQPAVRSAVLSPDGSRMAYLARMDGDDYLVMHDFAGTGPDTPIVKVSEYRTRGLAFNDNNHVIIYAGGLQDYTYVNARSEKLIAFSINLTTRKLVTLLGRNDDVYDGQTYLANIAAVDPDGQHVYMALYTGNPGDEPIYDVLKVNLDTGASVRGQTLHGDRSTIGWLVDPHGKPQARQTYDRVGKQYEILLYSGKEQRKVLSEPLGLGNRVIVGVSSKDGALIASDRKKQEFSNIFTLNAEGKPAEPLFKRESKEIDGYIMNANNVIYGVMYSGMYPSYEMFDPALDADINSVVGALPGISVYLASWTQDWSQLLFRTSGGARSERYMLFNRTTKKLTNVAPTRPDVAAQDIGEVTTVEYKARDGLVIPAIITWPAGVAPDKRKNLPLVVLPHGGPEAYDSVHYDWLSQFIANEGYMVLQPNFRGSAGFGATFRDAGRKQWGRKSQDDISDGAKALAAMGWADPKRTCIVGWSYGGYAALAGGAFTPELYKCVVSIAGVSNPRQMIERDKNLWGEDGPYRYWREVIGDLQTDRDAIDAVSPVRHAADFKAPVLLVHGAEDSTVDPQQSDQMEAALLGAKKSVAYIRIRGDEHSLVNKGSREQMLTALSTFLNQYLR